VLAAGIAVVVRHMTGHDPILPDRRSEHRVLAAARRH